MEKFSNDIGDALGSRLSQNEKYHILSSPWVPPKSYTFPSKTHGSRVRKFQGNWLKEFPWLSYSKKLDGGFCRFCVLFPPSSSPALGQLVSEPLHDFAKGKSYLQKHATRQYHMFATEQACNFKDQAECKILPIDERLNAKTEIEKERCRNGLRSIIKSVLYLARQGQPLRGHRNESRESIDISTYEGTSLNASSANSGNFLSLLEYTAAFDELLAEHIKLSPGKRLYISKDKQNEILTLAADQITQKIVQEVKDAGMFSVTCDECGDISNMEQLAITVRYVKNGKVSEKFLAIVECNEGTSGEVIAQMILNTLDKLTLDVKDMVALTTDGAGNMAGRIKGAAAKLQEKIPQLQHIHCLAHVLNLTIVSACKNQYVSTMFATAQKIYAFFSPSPKRTDALKSIIDKSADRSTRIKKKLKEVCHTRWVERYNALETLQTLLPEVVECLENIIPCADWNQDTRDKASQLLDMLTGYKFLVSLVITTNILVVTRGLCKKLQGQSYDIFQALQEVRDTVEHLQRLRDGCFNDGNTDVRIWFEQIDELASRFGTEETMPRVSSKQIHRNSTPASTPREFYIRNIALPFIDELISEISRRYDMKNKTLLSLFALVPATICKLKLSTEGWYKAVHT